MTIHSPLRSMCQLRRILLRMVTLPAIMLAVALANDPASVRAQAAPSSLRLSPPWLIGSVPAVVEDWKGVSDADIDSIGDQIVRSNDFRSVRRRVLEQIPDAELEDGEGGFLSKGMSRLSEGVSSFFSSVRSFFRNLIDKLFSSSPRRPATAPAPRSSSSSGTIGDGIGASLANLVVIVVISVLLLLLITIAAMIIRNTDRSRKKRSADDQEGGEENLTALSTPPGEQAASTYEQRAIQLAAEGQYRPAIRELLLGSMSWIERTGAIRFRRGLTNRDYVRAIWRQRDNRNAFGRIALSFERVYFGRRPATAEMFDQALKSFQGAFRETETTSAV